MKAFHTILIGFGIILLTGCQRLPASSFCALSSTITYSATFDTSYTVRQIQEHNALYQELCIK